MTLDTTSITGDQLLDGYTLNLTRDGSCTASDDADCVVTSNFTGGTIINPVRSARLSTKNKKTITYGRVEVVAKMPAGDWLWPAIWYVSLPYYAPLLLSICYPQSHSHPLSRQDAVSRFRLRPLAEKWRD